MKKFLVAALFVVSVAPNAFAKSNDSDVDMTNYDPRTSVVQDLENGPAFTTEANQSSSYSLKTSSVGDILKRIIGDVIRAEVSDRDHGRGGYRDQVTCYARNARGEYFRASGNRPRQVQARAIDKCYAYSRICRPVGCQ